MTKRAKAKPAKADPVSEADLYELYDISEEEDRRITEAALADPDAQPITEEMAKHLRPMREVDPDLVDNPPQRIGRPPADDPKISVHIRLDREVVEHFKAGGPRWQTRINQALRHAVERYKRRD